MLKFTTELTEYSLFFTTQFVTMGGTVPLVRNNVAIVLGMMSVWTQMVAVRVIVVMVSLETDVWMVSYICYSLDSESSTFIFVSYYRNIPFCYILFLWGPLVCLSLLLGCERCNCNAIFIRYQIDHIDVKQT